MDALKFRVIDVRCLRDGVGRGGRERGGGGGGVRREGGAWKKGEYGRGEGGDVVSRTEQKLR